MSSSRSNQAAINRRAAGGQPQPMQNRPSQQVPSQQVYRQYAPQQNQPPPPTINTLTFGIKLRLENIPVSSVNV